MIIAHKDSLRGEWMSGCDRQRNDVASDWERKREKEENRDIKDNWIDEEKQRKRQMQGQERAKKRK